MVLFFSQHPLTPAASRIVERCRLLSQKSESSDVWAGQLVLALLLDESIASACLRRLGVSDEWLMSGVLGREVAEATASSLSADRPAETVDTGQFVFSEPAACATDVSLPFVGLPVHSISALNDPGQFSEILEHATSLSRHAASENGVSSSHLLLAVIARNDLVRNQFQQLGITASRISQELGQEISEQLPQLPVQCTLKFSSDESANQSGAGQSSSTPSMEKSRAQQGEQLTAPSAVFNASAEQNKGYFSATVGSTASVLSSSQSDRIWRVIDACLNRAREGLRVLEDFARFVADEEPLTRRLKELRHSLIDAELTIGGASGAGDDRPSGGASRFLRNRNTASDVGTSVTMASEVTRRSPQQIVIANCRRVQESLRSLEEFGKLLSVDFALRMKQLRYQTYEIERQFFGLTAGEERSSGAWRRQRLQTSYLYVLVTERLISGPWKPFVSQILEGGADILQIREKHLGDRELLKRSRWLADACREAGALSIVNDRIDVAVLSGADGVHVGQDEISAGDARSLLGTDRLLGLSTHNLQQVADAISAQVDYIGTGPVFPGSTKSFDEYPGLNFIRQVSERQPKIPWFPIGGISSANLGQLIDLGAKRVALTAALAEAVNPTEAAAELRGRLLESDYHSGMDRR